MPQLIFKGVKKEDVKKASKTLPPLLSELTNTPMDYFTFERPNNEYFFNGEDFEMYPLIEIIQYDRGEIIEENMAEIIAKEIRSYGYNECEVYFTHVKEDNYFVL